MCETKSCNKCGVTKSAEEFSRSKGAKDGLQYTCKQCQNAYKRKQGDHRTKVCAAYYSKNKLEILSKMSEYSKANRELKRAQNAAYLEKNKDKIAAYRARYYLANKEQFLARNSVKAAIVKGVLAPAEVCELCGSTDCVEHHHPDYSKPLKVLSVCRSCHKLLHAGVRLRLTPNSL